MKYGKSIATFMAALMSLVSITYPILAQSSYTLGQYPSFLLNSNGSLNALIVVGASASPQDVIAATDLATRLAQSAATTVSVPGTSASINGLQKNTIDINFGNLTDVFPNPVRSFVYSGLQTGTISFKGNTYNYHEDINLGLTTPGIYFSHDFATSGINGTETMVVPSGSVGYEYVFDTALNCTALATTAMNTCTLSNLEYNNPVDITMMGLPFVIVGIGSNQITMLSGSVGTATATSGVVSTTGNYTVYSDLGANGAWARVIVKDSSGNTVATQVIDQGNSYNFVTQGITVEVTNVQALQDGTVVGTSLVVGPTGQTTVTYSSTCSVGGTGSSNFNFPGQTNWCIQTKTGSFANSGAIVTGDTIQVVYKPGSTQYFKWGGSTINLPLPNNYGNVGFQGWNYNTVATLTFQQLSSGTVFYAIGGGSTNSTPVAGASVSGIQVSSDTAGTLIDPYTNIGYSKVAYLFNTTMLNGSTTVYPVMVAEWDSVNGRWGVNLTAPYYLAMNDSGGGVGRAFNFNFTVSYGGGALAKDQKVLFASITTPSQAPTQTIGGSGAASYFSHLALVPSSTSYYLPADCVGSNCGTLINYVNESSTWSSGTTPQFQLYTTSSADPHDVQVVQTPAGGSAPVYDNIGQSTQNVVANGGDQIVAPDSNGGSATVVIQVPAQTLYVEAYIGSQGTTSTSSGTYSQVVPVTQPVAYLDSEITPAQEASNSLILVGGPCVNTLVAQLATPSGNSTTALFPYTCASWPASNFGYLQVIPNAFGTGYPTLVVAGTQAAQTIMAANVLQQYDTLLVGQTSQAVQITSLSTSGITAVSG